MFLIGVFLAYLLMMLGCIYAGLSPLEVIDIPSILIVFFPTLILGYFSNRSQFIPAFKNLIFGGEYSELDRAAHAGIFKVMGKISLGSGWLGVMIGAIAMLKNLGKGDLSAWGVGCAAALITILYGYGFTYLFCVPAANKVRG
jgi:flagellar motor component MotA